ncbi:TIGR04222 domain-containing membrane protein [Streptomyces sp. NPDC057654]|uniref:TIGR04222 domain-containing membrane protein n=1 Tax=Streptomyces sp. NPDC057654 TaxID=3346196 RepID=UPI0036C84B1E
MAHQPGHRVKKAAMWVIFLLVAWGAAFLTCARLCLIASAAALAPASAEESGADAGALPLTLYEAAFLAGGPHRVTDLALVSMSRQRRLLLAHTGWATVVDPVGHDDMERSVITAIGPEGQSRVPAIRTALTAADSVRALAERLTAAGLAVSPADRTNVSSAIGQVRGACALVVAMAVATLLITPPQSGAGPMAAWFALPLVLTLGCLAIVRYEIRPYTHWASPAGARVLGRMGTSKAGNAAGQEEGEEEDGPAGERSFLTALAVRGRAALADPQLRAALAENLRGPHD